MVGLNLKQASGEPVYAVTLDSTYNVMMWCPTFRGKGGRGATYLKFDHKTKCFGGYLGCVPYRDWIV